MGISRDSRHKRRLTGGRRNIHQKKRKYELGRVPAATKLVPSAHRVHQVRVRGGATKQRALRLDSGSFAWGSEGLARKTRILDVVYNASNNELVRTKTLVKNTIVQIDATAYRQWYEQHYGVTVGKKKKGEESSTHVKKSKKVPTISKLFCHNTPPCLPVFTLNFSSSYVLFVSLFSLFLGFSRSLGYSPRALLFSHELHLLSFLLSSFSLFLI
jgi:small subunit ribosomal protein S8e